MVIKKLFFLIIILALCLPFAFAQDEAGEDANFFIDRSGDEPRVIQRLLWEAARYVLRYEVIIEQLDDEDYEEIDRFSVESNSVEVSLTAGKYRYRLDVYDLLDEFSFATEWREFEILPALRPRLTFFNPNAFWLDEDDVWVINLYGQNLLQESVFYLVQDDIIIAPSSHTANGTSARLEFAVTSLVMGEYSIYILNPGGFDTVSGRFTIGNRKPFDLNIFLGYAPIIPLYGYLFNDAAMEAPFSGSLYPLGVAAKASYVPFKRLWGSLGAELSSSFSALEQEKENYTANVSLMNIHLSFLYQRVFYKRTLVFNASAGLGITSLINFQYEYPIGPPSETITGYYPSVIFGTSLTMFFFKPFFVNAGLDLIHVFTPSQDGPMPGFVRPSILVGIQL